ncbi:type IV secretion system protein [Vibrio aerogenes]|uniref:type IV secretion system protein n=1 Tax=Vibrio aerogenes TaxID=92172 RepID=UPI0021C30EE2|nr:type IV secretion system protein [Vibrio aerogenes]
MKRAACLSALIWLMCPVSANASGIPVVDVASIAQMVQQAAIRARQFLQTIETARNNLAAIKAQSDYYQSMVEGHPISYEAILYDPNLRKLADMSGWQALYESVQDVSDLRQSYGLLSDNQATQLKYDQALRDFKIQQQLYQTASQRNKNILKLLDEFGTATTPATKSDLANSINFQVAALQNEQKMMEAFSTISHRKAQLEIEGKNAETIDMIMNSGLTVNFD